MEIVLLKLKAGYLTEGRVVREEDRGQEDDGRMNGDCVDDVGVRHAQQVGHGVWCVI